MRASLAACAALLVLAGAGCGGSSDKKPDETATATGPVTVAGTTSEPDSSSSTDAGTTSSETEAGSTEAGTTEAGTTEAATTEAEPTEAGTTETATTETGTAVAEPRFALAPTVGCLASRPVVLASERATDPRIRALQDLAQRRSVLVRDGRTVVGLAITRRATDARLLAELLRVPDDRYRILRRGNAVLFFNRSAEALSMTVLDCLRPRR